MSMASRRQRRKQSRDRMGRAGIAFIAIAVGGFLFFANQISDPVDSKNCSINDGPKGVTAIVFDKSYPYSITTSRYLNQFLNVTSKDRDNFVKSGAYKIADLNK